ncbi:hypothetical protein C0989_007411 [Termitomyces sp. Mn162]|nr:hypothetical protein C0989_007411 [Termitomyces sp. Mn162]
MDNLTVGMTVSAPAVASASNTAKVCQLCEDLLPNDQFFFQYPVGALAVARREGWSKGRRGKEAANCGDIQEAGPSTPKAVAGSVASGLAMSPQLATTPRSKGKGKAKAQDEEDEDIEEQIEETFTNKRLATLLCWQKALMVVDTGLGAGVKLEKAKGKVTVSLAKQQEYKRTQGVRLQTIASEEGERNMEMREMTPLAMVAEVEQEASNMEIKGEEELKVVPVATEEDKEEESAEEGTWSDTPLCQVGDNKLEWLGEDLGWLTLLRSVALLVDFNKRVAGVEWRFQRELEAAREELLVAQAWYTIAKQTLATLAGYWHDCQTFLAWQEENNIGEGDWEEVEAMEVPEDNADLDA